MEYSGIFFFKNYQSSLFPVMVSHCHCTWFFHMRSGEENSGIHTCMVEILPLPLISDSSNMPYIYKAS